MRIRIHLPDRSLEQRRSLRQEVRSLLGLHRRRIESVEIRALDIEADSAPGGRLCEVTVRLRKGGYLSIIEQVAVIGRALLRAAWRVEQRRELECGRFPSVQSRLAAS